MPFSSEGPDVGDEDTRQDEVVDVLGDAHLCVFVCILYVCVHVCVRACARVRV